MPPGPGGPGSDTNLSDKKRPINLSVGDPPKRPIRSLPVSRHVLVLPSKANSHLIQRATNHAAKILSTSPPKKPMYFPRKILTHKRVVRILITQDRWTIWEPCANFESPFLRDQSALLYYTTSFSLFPSFLSLLSSGGASSAQSLPAILTPRVFLSPLRFLANLTRVSFFKLVYSLERSTMATVSPASDRILF